MQAAPSPSSAPRAPLETTYLPVPAQCAHPGAMRNSLENTAATSAVTDARAGRSSTLLRQPGEGRREQRRSLRLLSHVHGAAGKKALLSRRMPRPTTWPRHPSSGPIVPLVVSGDGCRIPDYVEGVEREDNARHRGKRASRRRAITHKRTVEAIGRHVQVTITGRRNRACTSRRRTERSRSSAGLDASATRILIELGLIEALRSTDNGHTSSANGQPSGNHQGRSQSWEERAKAELEKEIERQLKGTSLIRSGRSPGGRRSGAPLA